MPPPLTTSPEDPYRTPVMSESLVPVSKVRVEAVPAFRLENEKPPVPASTARSPSATTVTSKRCCDALSLVTAPPSATPMALLVMVKAPAVASKVMFAYTGVPATLWLMLVFVPVIVTSSPSSGTFSGSQFASVVQSVSVPPTHSPVTPMSRLSKSTAAA